MAMLLVQQKRLSILDFGEGMGLQYLEVISKVPESENNIDYYVVDGKAFINNRPEELNCFSKLRFHCEIDELNAKVDVIHIGSTLQYIEDWEELLQPLVNKFKPKYLVFSDLLAGNIPTFVSHQIFYDKRIPHQFINLEDCVDFLTSKIGMSLYYRTKFIRQILDQEEIFPNFGLPEKYRIDRASHLIFAKQ